MDVCDHITILWCEPYLCDIDMYSTIIRDFFVCDKSNNVMEDTHELFRVYL